MYNQILKECIGEKRKKLVALTRIALANSGFNKNDVLECVVTESKDIISFEFISKKCPEFKSLIELNKKTGLFN